MAELADMKLFVQTVITGSLSAAGRELGFSPAVGSKRLARLEASLGTLLLQRSSRRLSLTDEGSIYFERCQAILADVDEAEASIGRGAQGPRGVLRVSSPVALGRRWIGPAIAGFALDNPGVSVQLSLSDSVVDLIAGSFDCAVRIGGVEDSRLVARPLASNRRVVCAAPAYLARREAPQQPADLAQHDCIVMTPNLSGQADWRFQHKNGGADTRTTVRVHGRMVTDNGDQAHDWALAGLGLIRRSFWDVKNELGSGQLVEVLTDWSDDNVPIQVVYASRRFLPARTRQFIDLLVAQFAAQHTV